MENLKIGNIDLDRDAFHDQLKREHDSRAVLVIQNNSLHARQRTAADPGSLAYREKWVRGGLVQIQALSQGFDFNTWKRRGSFAGANDRQDAWRTEDSDSFLPRHLHKKVAGE